MLNRISALGLALLGLLFKSCSMPDGLKSGYKIEDQQVVFYHGFPAQRQLVAEADPRTFKSINREYGKDKTQVFYYGKILPKADPACRHLTNLVKEFEANFTELTKHCRQMRKVALAGRAISRSERNQLVRKVKELFNVPSWGSVVVSSMPKECLERRDLVYRYQREGIESFQGLIRKLDHLANDRDPLR